MKKKILLAIAMVATMALTACGETTEIKETNTSKETATSVVSSISDAASDIMEELNVEPEVKDVPVVEAEPEVEVEPFNIYDYWVTADESKFLYLSESGEYCLVEDPNVTEGTFTAEDDSLVLEDLIARHIVTDSENDVMTIAFDDNSYDFKRTSEEDFRAAEAWALHATEFYRSYLCYEGTWADVDGSGYTWTFNKGKCITPTGDVLYLTLCGPTEDHPWNEILYTDTGVYHDADDNIAYSKMANISWGEYGDAKTVKYNAVYKAFTEPRLRIDVFVTRK